MRIEGTLRAVGRSNGRTWVCVATEKYGSESLLIQPSDYDRCCGMVGQRVGWDAYPEVELVQTAAEERAADTAFLVDALKAKLGDLPAEERAAALERLGAT